MPQELPSPAATEEIAGARRSYLRAQHWTLALSAPAMLLVLSTLEGWGNSLRFVLTHEAPEVAVGYLAMLTLVRRLAATRRDPRENVLRFGMLQMLVFLLGVVAGCATNWLRHDVSDPTSWFVKPAVALATFGCLPAIGLGVMVAFAMGRLAR